MGKKFDPWVMVGCLLALLIVQVAPKLAMANPQRRGRLSVISSEAKASVKIASPSDLNQHLVSCI